MWFVRLFYYIFVFQVKNKFYFRVFVDDLDFQIVVIMVWENYKKRNELIMVELFDVR